MNPYELKARTQQQTSPVIVEELCLGSAIIGAILLLLICLV